MSPGTPLTQLKLQILSCWTFLQDSAVKPKCCEPPFSLLAYPKAHFLMFLWFFNIDTPKNVIKKLEIGPTGAFLCCGRYLFCKKYIFSKKQTEIDFSAIGNPKFAKIYENAIFSKLWFFFEIMWNNVTHRRKSCKTDRKLTQTCTKAHCKRTATKLHDAWPKTACGASEHWLYSFIAFFRFFFAISLFFRF